MINPFAATFFFGGVAGMRKESNFIRTEQPQHWSFGSNCIETKDALKGAASLGPYARLHWAGARMDVHHTSALQQRG